MRHTAAREAQTERPVSAEVAGGRPGGRPTALEDYPRPSAMPESDLIHAYGGLPSALRDPAVSRARAGDLQPDQPSAEDELCMEPECAHVSADHGSDGCVECPCRGFDDRGPADEYDRWVDDQLTDRMPMT